MAIRHNHLGPLPNLGEQGTPLTLEMSGLRGSMLDIPPLLQ
jgi:hypothetical protein